MYFLILLLLSAYLRRTFFLSSKKSPKKKKILRATMCQDRLLGLGVLAAEQERANNTNLTMSSINLQWLNARMETL